jgi:hypothetical protein
LQDVTVAAYMFGNDLRNITLYSLSAVHSTSRKLQGSTAGWCSSACLPCKHMTIVLAASKANSCLLLPTRSAQSCTAAGRQSGCVHVWPRPRPAVHYAPVRPIRV